MGPDAPAIREISVGQIGGRSRWLGDEGQIDSMAIGPDGTIWLGGAGRLYRIEPLD